METDYSFYEEEVRCGYLVTKERKKIWAVELDLLENLLAVCETYHLNIYADAGTLLGAVRHKGFIPWDDDIDMIMFREDYDQLIAVADKVFSYPYHLQVWGREKDYIRGHAQLRNSATTGILKCEEKFQYPFDQGIFLDIFVLDGVPDDKNKLRGLRKEIESLKKKLKWCVMGPYLLKDHSAYLLSRFKRKLQYLFYGKNDPEKLCAKLDDLLRENTSGQSEWVAPLSFQFDTKKRIRKKCLYDKTIWLPFENRKIPVPGGYDEYLSNRYGDYKKLVQDPTSHGDVIFYTDFSYKEYFECHKNMITGNPEEDTGI